MATVHYGRLLGPVGFSRTVAIKRLHAQFAKDPEFAAMFLDEARLAARIRHPNVVPTLDVVALDGELFLVMDYVQGESLGRLIRASAAKKEYIPVDIISSIVCGVLHGLHAAHEATNEGGDPLGIVHRDVSPQNVLVGADGVPRVLDFGVAKAAGRMQTTREGQLKGKLAYMSPEQLRAGTVDRRTDVYAAGVVLWETICLRHLFTGESEGAVVTKVLEEKIVPPSTAVAGLPSAIDGIVLKALNRDAAQRYESARAMALALEAAVPIASPTRINEWLQGLVGELLAERAKSVALVERDSGSGLTPMPLGSAPKLLGDQETKVTGSDVKILPARTSSPPRATGVSSISVSTSSLAKQLAPKRSPVPIVLAVGGVLVAALAVVAPTLLRPAPPPPSAVTSPPPAPVPGPFAGAPAAPSGGVAVPSSAESGSSGSAGASPGPGAAGSASATAASSAPVPAPPTASAAAADAPSAAPASGSRPASRPGAGKHNGHGGAAAWTPPVKTPLAVAPSPTAPTAAAPTAPATPTCTVQSYLDENGIKHYSKECK
jgi:serine/threonine-protein kinase